MVTGRGMSQRETETAMRRVCGWSLARRLTCAWPSVARNFAMGSRAPCCVPGARRGAASSIAAVRQSTHAAQMSAVSNTELGGEGWGGKGQGSAAVG